MPRRLPVHFALKKDKSGFISFKLLNQHLHDIKIYMEKLEFKLFEDFVKWKENEERTTNSFCVKNKTVK